MKDLLKGTNLYLVGMMGVGKTTIGQLLAKEVSYQFFDTDAVIEQATRQSIPQLFAESGEAAFRQLETQVLSQLSAYKEKVIATGGGIVLAQHNWSYLHHGVVIWLDAPVEQLYQRLQRSTNRPLLQTSNPQQTLQEILDRRRSLYAQADIQVTLNPNETPLEVTRRTLDAIQARIKPQSPSAPDHPLN